MLKKTPNLKTLQILLLEDEPMVAMDLEASLEDIGFEEITLVESVDAALKAVEKTEFDVAFLDVNVIGGNSMPVAQALQSAKTKIIFASGYVIEKSVLEEFKATHMTKPFSESDLKKHLRLALPDQLN